MKGFTDYNFYIFFFILFLFYWFINSKSKQNYFILIFGYFFYYSIDSKFFLLLIGFTLSTFLIANIIHKSKEKYKKKITIFSITFFIFLLLGLKSFDFIKFFVFKNDSKEKFIIPLGISFYFIHGITYLIDIYKNKIELEKNLVNYSIFINFFPLLVSGPIEKADSLLPQINSKRNFVYTKISDGLKLILWGLFQKLVISDLCEKYSRNIIDSYSNYDGSTLYLSFLIFSIQIYADFAGYSNIALGLSNMLGFNIRKNFFYPYFSTNIRLFWRRWHMSLNDFFKTYIYIPLGGNKKNFLINILIIFILSGIWHGLSLNFILWGIYHFIIYIIFHFLENKFQTLSFYIKTKIDFFKIIFVFNFVSLGWILFKTEKTEIFLEIFDIIFSKSFFTIPQNISKEIFLLIFIFLVIEWHWYKKGEIFKTQFFSKLPLPIRFVIYSFFVLSILVYSNNEQPFIYFQF